MKQVKHPIVPSLSSLPRNIDLKMLEDRRNTNRVGAKSALAPSYCSKSINEIASIRCNLSEFPYRLSAFLLRPFPFVDQGSSVLLFAGLENLVWLFLILVTVINVVKLRLRSAHREYIVSFSLFLVLFASAAALYEGNMGTAFRHKSTLLGHLILLNFLAIWSQNLKTLELEYKKSK